VAPSRGWPRGHGAFFFVRLLVKTGHQKNSKNVFEKENYLKKYISKKALIF